MKLQFLWLFSLVAVCSQAHHEAYIDTTYMKTIGDASVSITHDRYYDNHYWDLTFFDQTSKEFPPAAIILNVSSSKEEGLAASFIFETAPNQSETKPTLEYKFDDGSLTSTDPKISTLNDRHYVVKFTKEDFLTFLENLSKATTLSFAVGQTEQILQLNNLKDAIKEYRSVLLDSQIFDSDSKTNRDEDAEEPSNELELEAQDLLEA